MIASNNGFISVPGTSISVLATPVFADAKINGQSSCSSLASRSIRSSSTSSTTSAGLASGRSILLIQTITLKSSSSAFFNTNFVCGIAPSNASTTRITPFTIFRTRSTSPPKSACPGVSIMLILVSPYITAVFLDRMVIPLSRSISLESITRSATS